jgi:dTDP-glucose 4,6-dehydratase
MRLIVTGGAGFIGSALIRYLLSENKYEVLNIDKLTYAGNTKTLEPFENNTRYHFEQVDICDEVSVKRIFNESRPHGLIHLAAESHVDRSLSTLKFNYFFSDFGYRLEMLFVLIINQLRI